MVKSKWVWAHLKWISEKYVYKYRFRVMRWASTELDDDKRWPESRIFFFMNFLKAKRWFLPTPALSISSSSSVYEGENVFSLRSADGSNSIPIKSYISAVKFWFFVNWFYSPNYWSIDGNRWKPHDRWTVACNNNHLTVAFLCGLLAYFCVKWPLSRICHFDWE